MESDRFDALIGRFAAARSRRGVIVGLISGALGVRTVAETAAKQHHHKHKHKRSGASPGSPPHVPATCRDGMKNGTETDVDCGGACARCGDGKACVQANDCVSGTCTGGACLTCVDTQLCGSDANGACQCSKDFPSNALTCHSSALLGLTVMSCDQCPAGTEVCVTINGLLFDCYKRCGSA